MHIKKIIMADYALKCMKFYIKKLRMMNWSFTFLTQKKE